MTVEVLPPFAFFLGGQDLEMVTIAALLADLRKEDHRRLAAVYDRKLPWGARASAYGDEVAKASESGWLPVLVELGCDMGLPLGCIVIEHHGDRSGGPSALRQIFDLLAMPERRWTRDLALVAANDKGYIPAMARMGATAEEIAEIRRRDRRAQGITVEEEAAGLAAVARADLRLDGSLIVVQLPHERTATVADPLALRGDRRDLLILCPTSTQFFGDGLRIAKLNAAWPDGWRGGELPGRGFWGMQQSLPLADVLGSLA